MRPDRAVVKKAIVDSGNNLRQAAALLGCTRQTLYTWIYQHGLERFAGVRMDTRAVLDTRECRDTRNNKQNKSGVYSGQTHRPILRAVETQAASELPIQATVKVRESLWKRAKIEAINRGCTLGELIEASLEATLPKSKEQGK